MSLQGPGGSRDGPTGSQGFKGYAYGVSGGLEVGLLGLRGSRGRPTLQGPRGSTGRPTGSRGGQGVGLQGSKGSNVTLTSP